MAVHSCPEHRTGTARHTLRHLATEIGTPSRPKHPTCRTSCESSRHVGMPSRKNDLLAVTTARMRSCQRWEESVRQRSAIESGAVMGAVAVCSARRGCCLRGMMCGNALETAERAGEGQGGTSSNQTLAHLSARVSSRSSTSSAKSQVLFSQDDQENVGQPQSTLRTRRERVSKRQGSQHRAAWAARSGRSFEERSRSSTMQTPVKPSTCGHPLQQLRALYRIPVDRQYGNEAVRSWRRIHSNSQGKRGPPSLK